jgi:uncharacterized protein YkwD
MIRLPSRRSVCLGLLACVLPVRPLAAASGYRAYAAELLSALPAGVSVRPDLELVLDDLASAYRQGHSRGALEASDLLRDAARAQAADNMLRGKSSHRSRRGDEFGSRFAAYMGDPDLYPARGENAASDRKKGEAGEGKARRLFASWVKSSGHRRNLMSRDYEFVSTGVIQKGDELWAVQIFWSKQKENTPLFQ